MYKVKFGGKKGKTVELNESPDLVAVRTKGNKKIEDVALSDDARQMVDQAEQVVAFPEAGVTVLKVESQPAVDGLESTSGGGAPDTSKRDETRAALKQEEAIRFAGRVLQDKESGEVMLYTENFFLKFIDEASEADCLAVIQKYGLTIKSQLPFAPNSYFVQASEGTGLQVFDLAEKILEEKKVEFCHPELVQERRHKSIHPLQWHLDKTSVNGKDINAHVQINGAWKHTKGKGVTIAIIDDGVEVDHPEFAGRVVHPFDASMNNMDARPKMDDDTHGTACAGIACAAGLTEGASGTAPEAFLMPIRLRSGLGSMAEANAFAWAADHGADVISCSWGPADGDWWNPGDPLHQRKTLLPDSTRLAMQYALTKGRNGRGCVILFAAGNGNESTDNDGYVSAPGVITVAACNDTGKRAVYSDFGSKVWVSFPSGDYAWAPFKHPAPLSEGLRTTDRLQAAGYHSGNYTNGFGGTSAACPGMAGVVALMLAVHPALTPAQVRAIISRSCDKIDAESGTYGADGRSDWYGFGRINAQKAVEQALAAKDELDVSLEGRLRFSKVGEKAFLPDTLMGAQMSASTKLLGVALHLQPASPRLRLRYRVNISGKGVVENAFAGAMVGVTDARRKINGIAFALEGEDAHLYDVRYTAQLQKSKNLVSAQNGDFVGSAGKTGKAIQAISVYLAKKTSK